MPMLIRGCGFVNGLRRRCRAGATPGHAAPDDSGDHLHPNEAGYRVMAQQVDLRLLRPWVRWDYSLLESNPTRTAPQWRPPISSGIDRSLITSPVSRR